VLGAQLLAGPGQLRARGADRGLGALGGELRELAAELRPQVLLAVTRVAREATELLDLALGELRARVAAQRGEVGREERAQRLALVVPQRVSRMRAVRGRGLRQDLRERRLRADQLRAAEVALAAAARDHEAAAALEVRHAGRHLGRLGAARLQVGRELLALGVGERELRHARRRVVARRILEELRERALPELRAGEAQGDASLLLARVVGPRVAADAAERREQLPAGLHVGGLGLAARIVGRLAAERVQEGRDVAGLLLVLDQLGHARRRTQRRRIGDVACHPGQLEPRPDVRERGPGERELGHRGRVLVDVLGLVALRAQEVRERRAARAQPVGPLQRGVARVVGQELRRDRLALPLAALPVQSGPRVALGVGGPRRDEPELALVEPRRLAELDALAVDLERERAVALAREREAIAQRDVERSAPGHLLPRGCERADRRALGQIAGDEARDARVVADVHDDALLRAQAAGGALAPDPGGDREADRDPAKGPDPAAHRAAGTRFTVL
jgi:hypothetical protein